ncbi:probable 2-oxoglutarate/Fe(II)-dependent dioxygenase [Papaver somniferum]|uniref:probable 2-oxoglutarate/Fe(II)-dependent dioxygenase n=1 Tax=Papaver somniferum TaxID=3469 RepID=UPI000E70529B|nr:probable 2-oxoglutarate/Fe(II)-dependent dioxygenase [Papaver somniferum]
MTAVQQVTIPVIDFSFLTSGSPDQRSKVIEDLRNACQDWGFFMVMNHGVPVSLKKELMDSCKDFFDLSPEEKSAYRGNHVIWTHVIWTMDGTDNMLDHNIPAAESVSFWRDQLKVWVHPIFDSPPKPEGLSKILCEYTKRTREITKELLKAIMEGLEFEEDEIEMSLKQKSGAQIFSANQYPPCPQPELAIGLPPHTDNGILTLLVQNDIGGLQIKNRGNGSNNVVLNELIILTLLVQNDIGGLQIKNWGKWE